MICRILAASLIVLSADASMNNVDWPNVGNDKGGTRYSPLRQINKKNVGSLRVAWTYHCFDAGTGTTIECTPIVVDGVVYVTTVGSKVVALDPETGHEHWRFDPYANKVNQPRASGGVNRGLAFWREGKKARIFLGAADGRLISLDASTGKLDPGFGSGGIVDLRAGMSENLDQVNYGPTSAPAVYKNLVILGFSCPEGGRPAPGDPRAFDARTGKEIWRFHTIPRAGEYGNETWEGDSWKHAGAANNWGGTTVDEKRGLVFIGTGSASPDFYGGNRKGSNLFANCTICLDALTGKRLWHFQTIHHDLWDHDLPTPPNLVTVRRGLRNIDAAAQVTKSGFVFVFNRVTGEPLFPIEERPVPASDVPGELASPTQPFPLRPPPFCRQSVTEADLSNNSKQGHEELLKLFSGYHSGPAYVPPSTNGTVVIPGFHGGATWSGACFDPTTGILYLNVNNQANVTKLIPAENGGMEPFVHTGYNRFLDKEHYPGLRPPWGVLNAIDLNKGEILWQVPLGEFAELKARGLPQTGTENFGGTIVTAGGLIFIGATMDQKFHAFDKTSGKLLWETRLDAGAYATPCTYMYRGRQYVLIAAGGGGKLATLSGDSYVAFALPE